VLSIITGLFILTACSSARTFGHPQLFRAKYKIQQLHIDFVFYSDYFLNLIHIEVAFYRYYFPHFVYIVVSV